LAPVGSNTQSGGHSSIGCPAAPCEWLRAGSRRSVAKRG
jgi:hypothetical protein